MRNNINILITSAGQRVSLVKAFQTELRKVFSNAKVLTVDLNPVLAPACHVSDGFEKKERGLPIPIIFPNYWKFAGNIMLEL